MKEPNVGKMTIVETVEVKKAGGGIVSVPATDEIHRLKRRLSSLEVNGKDSYAHYADSFGDVAHDIGEVRGRLSEVGTNLDNLQERMHRLECPSPLLLDVVQRLCALDGGSDYEVHEKPYSCCEGCAEYPCERDDWMLSVFRGDERAYCYREKKTCGECRYPWSREHFGRPEQWVLVCDRVHEEETVGTELERVTRSRKACPNFEASC